MGEAEADETTEILHEIAKGNRAAVDRLAPAVYRELHGLAQSMLRREVRDHTLQPTALVNEAYLRLIDQDRVEWASRAHFFAIGAKAMRRILIDHARNRKRLKRGGNHVRVIVDTELALSFDRPESFLALDEALVKLRGLDRRQCDVVEMRFFSGMTMSEIAEALNTSKRTVEGDWMLARAWLRRELSDPSVE